MTRGTAGRAKSRAMRRWTVGGVRFAGAIVHHDDVVAGLADAEIERAGLADFGHGQNTVGEIFAQAFEIAAGHEREADLGGA